MYCAANHGHAEGKMELANLSGTELIEVGEAGDFRASWDPPQAPCGAFLLSQRPAVSAAGRGAVCETG